MHPENPGRRTAAAARVLAAWQRASKFHYTSVKPIMANNEDENTLITTVFRSQRKLAADRTSARSRAYRNTH